MRLRQRRQAAGHHHDGVTTVQGMKGGNTKTMVNAAEMIHGLDRIQVGLDIVMRQRTVINETIANMKITMTTSDIKIAMITNDTRITMITTDATINGGEPLRTGRTTRNTISV